MECGCNHVQPPKLAPSEQHTGSGSGQCAWPCGYMWLLFGLHTDRMVYESASQTTKREGAGAMMRWANRREHTDSGMLPSPMDT